MTYVQLATKQSIPRKSRQESLHGKNATDFSSGSLPPPVIARSLCGIEASHYMMTTTLLRGDDDFSFTAK